MAEEEQEVQLPELLDDLEAAAEQVAAAEQPELFKEQATLCKLALLETGYERVLQCLPPRRRLAFC
jgi:hypothetical protein